MSGITQEKRKVASSMLCLFGTLCSYLREDEVL